MGFSGIELKAEYHNKSCVQGEEPPRYVSRYTTDKNHLAGRVTTFPVVVPGYWVLMARVEEARSIGGALEKSGNGDFPFGVVPMADYQPESIAIDRADLSLYKKAVSLSEAMGRKYGVWNLIDTTRHAPVSLPRGGK